MTPLPVAPACTSLLNENAAYGFRGVPTTSCCSRDALSEAATSLSSFSASNEFCKCGSYPQGYAYKPERFFQNEVHARRALQQDRMEKAAALQNSKSSDGRCLQNYNHESLPSRVAEPLLMGENDNRSDVIRTQCLRFIKNVRVRQVWRIDRKQKCVS